MILIIIIYDSGKVVDFFDEQTYYEFFNVTLLNDMFPCMKFIYKINFSYINIELQTSCEFIQNSFERKIAKQVCKHGS